MFICFKESASSSVPAASFNTVRTAAWDSPAFAAVLTTITLTRNRASTDREFTDACFWKNQDIPASETATPDFETNNLQTRAYGNGFVVSTEGLDVKYFNGKSNLPAAL
jgi:hypothetical protein